MAVSMLMKGRCPPMVQWHWRQCLDDVAFRDLAAAALADQVPQLGSVAALRVIAATTAACRTVLEPSDGG